MADFFNNVYEVVRLVPKGRVTTYGAVANYLGIKMSARMVGWAMNAAHSLPDVPAHRVVNRQGLLTGRLHFSTPTKMAELLASEGIKLINQDRITNFNDVFWDPSVELEL